MNKFIVFNTVSQAKNYIKRQNTYNHREGCGCCGHSYDIVLKHNKVISTHINEYAGNVSINSVVVGRVKHVKALK